MTTAPKLIRDLHNIADDIAGISDALLSTNSLRGNQLRAISEHLRTLAAEPAGSTVTIHSGPINILASAEGMYKAKPDSAEGECQHDWKIWPETDGLEQHCMICDKYRNTPTRTTDEGMGGYIRCDCSCQNGLKHLPEAHDTNCAGQPKAEGNFLGDDRGHD